MSYEVSCNRGMSPSVYWWTDSLLTAHTNLINVIRNILWGLMQGLLKHLFGLKRICIHYHILIRYVVPTISVKEKKDKKERKNHIRSKQTNKQNKMAYYPIITIPFQIGGIIPFILNFKYLSPATFLGRICHQNYHI